MQSEYGSAVIACKSNRPVSTLRYNPINPSDDCDECLCRIIHVMTPIELIATDKQSLTDSPLIGTLQIKF